MYFEKTSVARHNGVYLENYRQLLSFRNVEYAPELMIYPKNKSVDIFQKVIITTTYNVSLL